VAALFEMSLPEIRPVHLPNTVIFESVYVLQQAWVSREDIVDALSSVIRHPGWFSTTGPDPRCWTLAPYRRVVGLCASTTLHLRGHGFTNLSFDRRWIRYRRCVEPPWSLLLVPCFHPAVIPQ